MRAIGAGLVILGILGAAASSAQAGRNDGSKTADLDPRRVERLRVRIESDPELAGEPVRVAVSEGRAVLKGRTRSIATHERIVRLAIESGAPFRDELVIDTRLGGLIPGRMPPPVGFGLPAFPEYPSLFDPITPAGGPWVARFGPGWNDPWQVWAFNMPDMVFPPDWERRVAGRDRFRDPEEETPAPPRAAEQPEPAGNDPENDAEGLPAPPRPDPELDPAFRDRNDRPDRGGAGRLNPLSGRVGDALAEVRGAGAIDFAVNEERGLVTLSGSAPDLETAIAARAKAAAVPGVAEVRNRVLTPMPPRDRPNPLPDLAAADREAVAEYVLELARRHVGDAASIDRVEFRGRTLVVEGKVDRAETIPRVEATLRSVPILNGLTILPVFAARF